MREDKTLLPDGLTGGATLSQHNRSATRGHAGAGGRLATAVLAHLPLAVAVIDAAQRLLYWNEQASSLFGIPPLMAADAPFLKKVLAGVAGLVPLQINRIIAFSATHILAGDRTEPESALRISLGRDHRLVIQLYGIGLRRWMLIIDDGKLAMPVGRNELPRGADAWLDPLTGLSNRRHFNQVLETLVDSASPDSRHAVLLIDLDRFQPINETLGHPIGDALLCLVAKRLRRETRDEDLLARFGGDEFVVLLRDTATGAPLATRMVEILSRPFLVEGHVIKLGVSAGIARFPQDGSRADDLMHHAELALYDAKSAGGRTWRVFDAAMAAQAKARRELEVDLRKALALGELSVVYTPQAALRTQALTGFEASLHWNHPTRGIIPPLVVARLAEATGCIVAVGEWMLQAACADAVQWPAPLTLIMHVSSRQLEDSEHLLRSVLAALQASKLEPERLELAVSEIAIQSQETQVLQTLHRLRALGVRIKLNDFTIGPSSLNRIQSFPFNVIKMDRSEIPGLLPDADQAVVINAVLGLQARLEKATSAGSRHTAEHPSCATPGGCLEIGGLLMSQPVPASEIDALLARYVPALQKVCVTA